MYAKIGRTVEKLLAVYNSLFFLDNTRNNVKQTEEALKAAMQNLKREFCEQLDDELAPPEIKDVPQTVFGIELTDEEKATAKTDKIMAIRMYRERRYKEMGGYVGLKDAKDKVEDYMNKNGIPLYPPYTPKTNPPLYCQDINEHD